MEKQDIVNYFSNILENEKDISSGMAAMMTLLEVLKHDESETVQGLGSNLRAAADVMKNTDYPITAVLSGCELFLRFITLTNLEEHNFERLKATMIERGERFLKSHQESRNKIATLFIDFISDGARILTHSKSRVVLQALIEAAHANKRFHVFVTTSSLDKSGVEMYKALEKANIECTLILDSAVGYVMENIDIVIVGAEGVVTSGGIINKIGTFSMAVCAKAMKKDVYVLAESFKFVNYFPLNQRDLRKDFKFPASKLQSDLSKEHPLVDYTPPGYIKLLFTEKGILTPTAVSDEILQMYL